ncbi:MAG: hypothetical protein V2I33_11570 [Kangiellaceae bacterium]|jgi:hypothetical protein|nr:hypothetical protein [Kangiellaceae bacterium]
MKRNFIVFESKRRLNQRVDEASIKIPIVIDDATIRELKSAHSDGLSVDVEYHVDIDFYSASITNDNQSSSATVIVDTKAQADDLVDTLKVSIINKWDVIIDAACMWSRDDGGIHFHDCKLIIKT